MVSTICLHSDLVFSVTGSLMGGLPEGRDALPSSHGHLLLITSELGQLCGTGKLETLVRTQASRM
jgi:hypothetical protein